MRQALTKIRRLWRLWQLWQKEERLRKQLFSAVLPLFGIIILVALAMRVYWAPGFPYTHDGENHLARFVNFAAALREGQYPPRFAPHVLGGYGFPVFHYNYPLANILAAPLLAIGFTPEQAFIWQVFLSLFLGSLGIWFLAQKQSFQARWLSLGLFLTSSSVLQLITFRGNIGEIWALGLLPFLWWCVVSVTKHFSQQKWLFLMTILVTSALLLAHNLSSLVSAGIFFVLTLWHWKAPSLRANILALWIPVSLSVAWFWLPAVLELPLVVLRSDELARQAAQHTLGLSQILFGPWRFGFSSSLPFDSFGFGLGWGAVALFALCSAWVFVNAGELSVSLRQRLFLLIGSMSGAVFLSSTFSEPIWRFVPLLQIIQFPWRLLVIPALLLPFLLLYTYDLLTKSWRTVVLALVGVQVLSFLSVMPVDRFTRESSAYLQFLGTTLTRDENRPQTLTQESLVGWSPTAQIATGSGEVRVRRWTGSSRTYEVEVETDALIIEPTVFFPGWQTRVGDSPVEYALEESGGLIAYRLQARTEPYTVQTSFSQRTPIRLLAEGLSILSIAPVIIILLWKRKRA